MVKTKDLAGLLHRLERPTGPVDVVLDTASGLHPPRNGSRAARP